MRITVLGSFVGALLVPVTLRAQSGRVVGTVVDAGGRALNAVQVSLDGTGLTALSNANGQYALASVAPGSYVVRAVRSGGLSEQKRVTVTSANTSTVDFTIASVGPLVRIISQANAALPLPADSVKLPVPDSAIVRRRQASRVAFAPVVVGQKVRLPLFRDLELVVEILERNATSTGYRANGRVVGNNGRSMGTIVLVSTSDSFSANIRYGLRLFLIRAQKNGIELIVEVDQSKTPREPEEHER